MAAAESRDASRHDSSSGLCRRIRVWSASYRPAETGRRPTRIRASVGVPADWVVLLRDRLPSYISWEQYEANQRQLRDNSSKFGRVRCARGAHCWVDWSFVGVAGDAWRSATSPAANLGLRVTVRVTITVVRNAKHCWPSRWRH